MLRWSCQFVLFAVVLFAVGVYTNSTLIRQIRYSFDVAKIDTEIAANLPPKIDSQLLKEQLPPAMD
jgi:hypothetical protein